MVADVVLVAAGPAVLESILVTPAPTGRDAVAVCDAALRLLET